MKIDDQRKLRRESVLTALTALVVIALISISIALGNWLGDWQDRRAAQDRIDNIRARH